MRIVVLAAAAVAALALTGASQPASTATKGVAIKATGFVPASVTISTSDAVKWANRDNKDHQIVANNGSFASALVRPGNGYTHVFKIAGTYRYHDALHPALTGKVVVKGPPPAVTIGATAPLIAFGQSTSISGAISSKQQGQTVTVWAQPYGQPSPVQLATLLTGPNGVWALPVKPTELTYYTAHWKNVASQQVGIQMRPTVMFSTNKRFGSVVVKADRSLEGRKVYLQKLTRFQQWVKIKGVILGHASHKYFRLGLTRGRYQLRIFMSFNQVGPGYLDGFSPVVAYRRK
jgi:plastocyanin